ncbi:hypothetical protein D3C83_198030 [compost metagenome]
MSSLLPAISMTTGTRDFPPGPSSVVVATLRSTSRIGASIIIISASVSARSRSLICGVGS